MDFQTASGLLGSIFGLFGKGGNKFDAETLKRLFGVGALNSDTQQLFNFLKGSPFGQFGQENAALQGSLFGDALKRQGAAIGSSGIGMLANAAASTTQAFQQGDFLSKLFSQAQSGAQENLANRLQAYTNGAGQTPPNLLSALGGALSQYALLNPKKEGSGGGLTPQDYLNIGGAIANQEPTRPIFKNFQQPSNYALSTSFLR